MLPSQGYVSISRRPPDVEDYIDIVRRHRAWIVGPAFAGLVIAVVVAFLWPDTFVSHAVLRITPPQIPESLVPSNLNTLMVERIGQMQQDIMSQGSLSDLITKYDLYKEDRSKKPLQDIIDQMRNSDVKVTTIDRGNRFAAFQISFSYSDRLKAKAVVDELVGKFTERTVKSRRQQANTTTNFLSEELRNAKAELDRLGAALSAFKMKNAGRLPEQVTQNAQALQALEAQLGAINDGLNRDAQDKMMLDTSLQNLSNQANSLQTTVTVEEPGAAAVKNERLMQLNRAILEMETRLAGLREVYKDDYPEVRNFKAQLELVRRQRDDLEKQEKLEEAKVDSKPKLRKITNPQAVRELDSIKQQIESLKTRKHILEMDMEEKVKSQAQINKLMQVYQSRIESSPLSEQRYAELIRDEAFARQRYEEFNKKESVSALADKADEKNVGEILEVLDPASTPLIPSYPNRWMIVGMGLGAGFTLGLFITGAQEVKDTSLKNLKDVRAYTNLAVLSSIPLLENALIVRRKRRLAWLAWSAAVILGIVAMSSSMYYYYFMVRT